MRSLVVATLMCLAASSVLASPPTLTAYVGKDPRENVQGVSFLRHPTVIAGVSKAVPAGTVRDWVLAVDDTTAIPVHKSDGWVIAHVCERHMCIHDWSILVDPASNETVVCYHDPETTGEKSRWYYASGQKELHDADPVTGGCPNG